MTPREYEGKLNNISIHHCGFIRLPISDPSHQKMKSGMFYGFKHRVFSHYSYVRVCVLVSVHVSVHESTFVLLKFVIFCLKTNIKFFCYSAISQQRLSRGILHLEQFETIVFNLQRQYSHMKNVLVSVTLALFLPCNGPEKASGIKEDESQWKRCQMEESWSHAVF